MTDAAPKRIWEFDRYINGVLMAEGVTVEKQPDIASAMKAAAIIASRGPHGEVPVLIVREADRDRLAAANAVLEAKVAGLRDLLERGAMHVSLSLRAWHGEVRAALATQEAGT